MPCKKSEFISMLNSYVIARSTNDLGLITLSGNALKELVDGLEYGPEEDQAGDSQEEVG